ncbi:MAG: CoA-binding protein, partial [Burkholderiaceae bacterium]
MTIRNLDALLKPRSVVVIGASGREGTVGNIVARNVASGAFKGEVTLVNPKRPVIAGRQAISSIAGMPAPADLAVVVTPPGAVAESVAAVAAQGTRAAVVITAGLSVAERQRMLDAARPHLLRVEGPNCIGLMLPSLGLNASFCHIDPLPGGLAFLSQSGALITGIVDWASNRGIGFSHIL